MDTTQWTGPRTAEHLVDFIVKVLPSLHTRLGQRSKSNGAPTLLYIAGAALRVADITRVLKDKRLQGDKGGEVAKLFAKHFKLAEHVTHLKRTKVGAAVGTPGRVGKLLNETDALSVSALSHIVLDITHRDAKTLNVLDIRETRDEIFQTILNNEHILKGIKEGKIQVVLF
jgi:protein CMS1